LDQLLMPSSGRKSRQMDVSHLRLANNSRALKRNKL
jgi:hypothetical protein